MSWYSINDYGFTVTDEQGATLEAFSDVYNTLDDQRNRLPWILGDMIVAAESRHGEKYLQFIRETHISYNTLRKYVKNRNHYPENTRGIEVSYSHYDDAATLPLPVSLKALKQAEAAQMSRDAFREFLKPLKDAEEGVDSSDIENIRREFDLLVKEIDRPIFKFRDRVLSGHPVYKRFSMMEIEKGRDILVNHIQNFRPRKHCPECSSGCEMCDFTGFLIKGDDA